ncbi:MAG TPA: DNA polymerase III subunit delta' C-terminal domain-containing protein [Balneolaceae bacterium]|nr:DNA polymerase III subunit delta' C-terminal domain-containing protein [Balneolaceae bacterium]
MDYSNLQFELGDQRLVGQQKARNYLKKILLSQRLGHAYLFSGPPGTGKTALALAFAELINGISNLTDLNQQAFSKKSSWLNHPDIHLFLPVPTDYNIENFRERLTLLADDPYEVVDFSHRPSLTDDDSTRNKQAFYPIDFFHEEVRPKAFLKPNEGRKTVVILTNIETMRKEAANAFLKLLEEPSEDLVFLLTTNSTEALLPTIISRCQHIQLSSLSNTTIENALIKYDQLEPDDAQYLARVSGGNYAMARFFDIDALKEMRLDIVSYLRKAYVQDAVELTNIAQEWQNQHNIEGQIALLNVLETFLRDLLIYRDTGEEQLITNISQIDTIKKFCESLQQARLQDMIEQVNKCRPLLYQYVQPKLVYTVLAFRFSSLMRDRNTEIPQNYNWQHLPAFIQ